MKPIIVTWANESWIMNSGKISEVNMGYMSVLIPNGGFYFAEHIISHEGTSVYESEIKLIARPKK